MTHSLSDYGIGLHASLTGKLLIYCVGSARFYWSTLTDIVINLIIVIIHKLCVGRSLLFFVRDKFVGLPSNQDSQLSQDVGPVLGQRLAIDDYLSPVIMNRARPLLFSFKSHSNKRWSTRPVCKKTMAADSCRERLGAAARRRPITTDLRPSSQIPVVTSQPQA